MKKSGEKITDQKPEKRTYVRPVIKRQYMGAANKFGGYAIPDAIARIDGVTVESLINKFGSPLFVFSEATLRRKIRELNQAFSSRYPHFQAAWSYKTNYLNAICNVFHEEGSWAEVVSGFEYQKARYNKIPGEKIIFNGPYKKYEALKLAVSEGAKIHADNLEELRDLKKISDELGRPVEIAIRINMDTGIYPSWSRFGFNLESGHALEAARLIQNSEGKLKLIGLHAHIGTFIYETEPYRKAALKLSEFFKKIRHDMKQPLRYIDLGGGFASTNKLKAVFRSDASTIPSFDKYAEEITSALYEGFAPEEPPQLFLETGRALVDEAGFLISSVVGSKTLANGRRSMTLDAGVNLLYVTTWYDLKVAPGTPYSGAWEEHILYGPLCMNIDVIKERCLLPNLQRGESVVIHPVGAYNITQAMQFIEMKPAVVLIGIDGNSRQIKKRETMQDIVNLEE
jgi:diaminopimelate decarboxylase